MSPRPSSRIAFLAAVTVALSAVPARADVSSWLFAGGGASALYRPHVSGDTAAAMQFDAGMGSSPAAAIAVGGLVRMQTRIGDGSDFGLFVRTATGGFVRGNWGGAIDLGGYERWWGPASAPGYAGSLVLGGPWGLTLSLNAARDTKDANTFTAVFGIDLARLSVYRTSGLGWMPNPFPTPPREGHSGL
ncbi:MAG TPA: hypothetical protein VHU80_11680 [Polyangiaceae bacterium]|nr:hypothetical protein [Polyangiaceae bacterium]